MNKQSYILPEWPAPKNIHSAVTTRIGGFSKGDFNSFNLATHVEDNNNDVHQNRQQLITDLALKTEPNWLTQVHGDTCVDLDNYPSKQLEADACLTKQSNTPCAVLTADCLPILLCNQQGSEVAAIHAGWKGILNGVIAATIDSMHSEPDTLLAWLGPAIGPQAFALNGKLRLDFIQHNPQNGNSFEQHNDQWLANIYQLASNDLNRCQVNQIYGGEFCTVNDEKRFFSYRRDQGKTGRMASLIWISN